MKDKTMVDELLDLVDENNNVIAVVARSQAFAQGIKNFRLVIIHIKDRDGNHFVVRRSYQKSYPGALAHVGGCVQSGETYEQAFLRELYEETGIDAQNMPYRLLGYLNPFLIACNGYTAIYEVIVDDRNIQFSQEDFADACWMPLSQIKKLMEDGHAATPNFPLAYKYFYPIE